MGFYSNSYGGVAFKDSCKTLLGGGGVPVKDSFKTSLSRFATHPILGSDSLGMNKGPRTQILGFRAQMLTVDIMVVET